MWLRCAPVFGEVAADGQRVRVAALATDLEGRVAFLSLVGYETSVSAALARILKREQVGFLPSNEVFWNGPSALGPMPVSYWMWRSDVYGTREKQGVLFPHCGSITHGLRNPPLVPVSTEANGLPHATQVVLEQIRQRGPDPAPLLPRIVFGTWNEETPTPAAFFGHLKGLRALVLPTLPWVEYLWRAGLAEAMIVPLLSLGIRAWRLDGDPRHWNALISEGVMLGRLRHTRPSEFDVERLRQ